MMVFVAFKSTDYEGCGEPIYAGGDFIMAISALYYEYEHPNEDYWIISEWSKGKQERRMNVALSELTTDEDGDFKLLPFEDVLQRFTVESQQTESGV